MQLVPSAVEDHLASYDNAGQVKDSWIAAGDVVLKGGAYLGLFAGYAANLVDIRSAGTPQGPYAFRQAGGDGVDYMVRIKGRTEAFNQLVQTSASYGTSGLGGEITLTNNGDGSITLNGTATATRYASLNITGIRGHAIYVNTGVTSPYIGIGDGTPGMVFGANPVYFASADSNTLYFYVQSGATLNNLTLWINVVDLTLEGLGLTTAAAFQSLHPLPYYNYNAGVLKNNAATGIKTRGFNQWDEQWEVGSLDAQGEEIAGSCIRAKNFNPAFPNTTYFINDPSVLFVVYFYDANKAIIPYTGAGAYANGYNGGATPFTTPAGTAYLRFRTANSYGTNYNHDICINLSDASRNGIYEPYWERTLALGLDSLACHDENNNAVTLNGLDGVGSAYDEAVVENGMVTKIIKRFEEVDLGDLTYSNIQDSTSIFRASLADYKPSANINSVNAKYQTTADNVNFYSTAADIAALPDKSSIKYYVSGVPSNQICFKDTAYSDAATFKAAVTGVKLRYELATPKVLTVDNPFPAFVEVDNLGTEKRLPEDTAADPQGPFESDSNYSVSTANLVRALGL